MATVREQMNAYIKELQASIFSSLQSLDPSATPRTDPYIRPDNGGESLACVIQDGEVFEKGGVNTSIINSTLSPAAVKQMRADHSDNLTWWDGESSLPYNVAGISCVVHPKNPMAPTIHFNYRYFEISDSNAPVDSTTGRKPIKAWWFGGGSDLTPTYLFEEDATHFHKTLRAACDAHDPSFYPKFKTWCDKYFFLSHRQESRGVGGIFFDDLSDHNPEELFAFVKACGDSFLPSYLPLVERRMNSPFTEQEKRWQQLRRGRYVEFNLVYDRGTKFGLLIPNAKFESILMSLPLTARWEYMTDMGVQTDTKENEILEVLRNPREWA